MTRPYIKDIEGMPFLVKSSPSLAEVIPLPEQIYWTKKYLERYFDFSLDLQYIEKLDLYVLVKRNRVYSIPRESYLNGEWSISINKQTGTLSYKGYSPIKYESDLRRIK